MIEWAYFPRSRQAPPIALAVVDAFRAAGKDIDSSKRNLDSNGVLARVAGGLKAAGFRVEDGKTKADKVTIPVLFGNNGRPDKTFDADAYHQGAGFVIEVEAGRGVVNNQFLRDFFKACVMHEVTHLGIAVRHVYRKSKDFERVCLFFDTLYASGRLQLPLEGILVIGY